jgi:L-malate glycosyltransferase
MRIALIRREFITHLDGVNKFIAILAEGFNKLGHESFILSWSYKDIEKDRLDEWFRDIHGLDETIPIYTLCSKQTRDQWLRIAWDWLIHGSRLLHNKDADLVIVNGVIPIRFKPKIAVNHGITLKPNKFYLFAIKNLYKKYDKVVCVSNKLVEEVENFLGYKKSHVIPLPIKLSKFKAKKFNQKENIILHIGTRDVKNPHISIETIKILRSKGYNVRLIIIGKPTKFSANKEVEYRHGITEEEKLELLSRAKALILPSSYEALPYVSLESMACGTPPIVSTAIPEEVIINGFNGIRVNSYNAKDYANSLEQLLRDEELWLKISKNGLEFVKRFDYIKIAKMYENLFNDIHIIQ